MAMTPIHPQNDVLRQHRHQPQTRLHFHASAFPYLAFLWYDVTSTEYKDPHECMYVHTHGNFGVSVLPFIWSMYMLFVTLSAVDLGIAANAPPWLVPHWDFTASVDLAQHWPKSKAFQMISSSTWGAGGQTSSSSISASLKMIKSTSTLICSSSTATVASSSLVSVATLTFLGLFVYTKATVRSFFGIIANNKLLCSRQPSLTRSSSA